MAADFRNDPALQPVLQHLEVERQAIAALKSKAGLYALIGILVVIGFGVLGIALFWFYIPGIAALIYALILYLKVAPIYSAYRMSFKMNVLTAILKSNYQDITFEPGEGLSSEEFLGCQLFSNTPDRYHTEDRITGSLAKTRFYFSEVDASYKTESTDSKGNKTETWHEIFKGIIFTADFNKNFNGITLIRPEDIGSSITGWFAKALPMFNSAGNSQVQLEDPEFNKTFSTHSTDQIEARYILTPSMMSRILTLNQKTKDAISLSFIASRVYIAFPIGGNYFEPPLKKSILEDTSIDQDLYIVQFMYDIVNELDLNTRIWGKN
ncbi:DUF3137 domain-containing protein [Pedobacter cryoconitis]|uniref:Uncharacterized protein DUF3137 n=1 Tax=Pedobacter cryoconitis TaxID=188932 RepID=A0A327SYX2_9SPHI|nr:DUF3137 domain-containing protein [Pedobacter cryoconitis]RAJ34159.1 uncharacterized protein DUF3137 [Pedobacter cryoconitis]